MRVLAFSDLHRDLDAARSIVSRSGDHDVVIGAGDFGSVRKGLQAVVDVLSGIETPAVVVPGNAESAAELERACVGWDAARVLHGSGVEIDGVPFYGLGAAVPVTPFGDWSFDLSEQEAGLLLEGCPRSAVLVSHSPPLGLVDADASGKPLGSSAVLDAVRTRRPRLVVCGHIHASWGREATVGTTRVVNVGPAGMTLEVE